MTSPAAAAIATGGSASYVLTQDGLLLRCGLDAKGSISPRLEEVGDAPRDVTSVAAGGMMAVLVRLKLGDEHCFAGALSSCMLAVQQSDTLQSGKWTLV